MCGLKDGKKHFKKDKEACDDKYHDTFIAKIAETYPKADLSSLKVWCHANPFDCPSDWKKMEMKAKELDEAANKQEFDAVVARDPSAPREKLIRNKKSSDKIKSIKTMPLERKLHLLI